MTDPKERLTDDYDNREHVENIEDYDNVFQQMDEDYGD